MGELVIVLTKFLPLFLIEGSTVLCATELGVPAGGRELENTSYMISNSSTTSWSPSPKTGGGALVSTYI